MEEFSLDRRTLLRGVAGAGAAAAMPASSAAAQFAGETDPVTRATFKAVVDAVIPETPELEDELGSEHVPGGLEVGLDGFLIGFVNRLFMLGNETLDVTADLRLSEVAARACDLSAVELLARAGNESTPDPTRFEAGGPFASLARQDRLRALALLDEKELDTAALSSLADDLGVAVPVVEGTAGLIPQLVVAFTQVVYYSEWQGYEDIDAPPSDREFSDADIQSWDQVEFPGVIDGSASFRGYWGYPDSSLAEGRVWKSVDVGDDDPRPQIRFEPGEFAEDDYDTTGYEEPFDTGGQAASAVELPFEDGSTVKKPDDAIDAAREEADEGLLEQVQERFFGTRGGAR